MSQFRKIVEKALREVKVIQPTGYDFEGKIYENPSKSDMYRLESQSKDSDGLLRGVLFNGNVYLADSYLYSHADIVAAVLGVEDIGDIPDPSKFSTFFVKDHKFGMHYVDPSMQKWTNWVYKNYEKLINSSGIKRLFTDEQLNKPFFTDEY